MIRKWRPKDKAIAPSSHGFRVGGTVSRELSSDRAFRALNISMATSTDSERVDAFALPAAAKMSQGSDRETRPPPARS